MWYLPLSSQRHRQGKVSVKVSGCRAGSVWRSGEYMWWQPVREEESKKRNEEDGLVKNKDKQQHHESHLTMWTDEISLKGCV